MLWMPETLDGIIYVLIASSFSILLLLFFIPKTVLILIYYSKDNNFCILSFQALLYHSFKYSIFIQDFIFVILLQNNIK